MAPSKQIFFFFVEDDIDEIELLPVTLLQSATSGLRLPVDEQFSELSVIIDIPENELGLHNELMDNFELSRWREFSYVRFSKNSIGHTQRAYTRTSF